MKFSNKVLILFFMFLASVISLHSAVPADTSGRTLTIRIDPVFNGEKLVLETKTYVSALGDTLQIERFRFYISSLEMVFQDGRIFSEKNSYHLIDAEEKQRLEVKLEHVPHGKIVAFKFNIGVDSIKSVSGAMDGDLDPGLGMYWAWNSGYINAKLEGRSRSCTTHQHRFEFHIGGYSFPENSLRKTELDLSRNKSGCFEGNRLVVTADAQSWLTGVYLNKLPGVTIPGKQAMGVADNYSKMFKVHSNEN